MHWYHQASFARRGGDRLARWASPNALLLTTAYPLLGFDLLDCHFKSKLLI